MTATTPPQDAVREGFREPDSNGELVRYENPSGPGTLYENSARSSGS